MHQRVSDSVLGRATATPCSVGSDLTAKTLLQPGAATSESRLQQALQLSCLYGFTESWEKNPRMSVVSGAEHLVQLKNFAFLRH